MRQGRAGLKRIVTVGVVLLLLASLSGGCSEELGADEILEKAIAAQEKVDTVRMRLETEISIDVPGTRNSEVKVYDGLFMKPDRWQLEVISGGTRIEAIIIGGTTYIKSANSDEWVLETGSVIDATTVERLSGAAYLRSAKDVRLLDKNADSYHLRYSFDLESFANAAGEAQVNGAFFAGKPAEMEVWILNDSFNLKKLVMNFSSDLTSIGTEGSIRMEMKAEYSEQNEPVTIEPPRIGAPQATP